MQLLTRVAPLALTLGAVSVGAVAETYGGYEAAPYQVVDQIGVVEIRAYAPHILAEVRVQGERRAALNQGFRILAGYIFGGNVTRADVAMTVPVAQSSGTTIAMTTPVAQSETDRDIWTISFMMPSEWTLETLPVPTEAAITFREADARREAVLVFSGRATAAQLADREAELRAALEAAGLAPEGAVQHYYYDDPFTLPWARRNEVSFVLGG